MSFATYVVPLLIVLTGTLIAWVAIVCILTVRNKGYRPWQKVTEFVFLSLVALVAAAVAGNSGFDAIVYSVKHPPGTMYWVNGHRMRIDCVGSGSPTIVLDAGLGNDGLIWSGVQPVLAKTTRVCSYDRAGFGGSDALPPPRDADHVATELHWLLVAAKVYGPVVLMGHSIAGLYIRDYANRYPAEIAGLVFVDSSTPLPRRKPAPKEADAESAWRRTEMWFDRAAFDVGLPRLFGACPGSFPGYTLRTAALQLEGLCREHFEAFVSEHENFDRSGEETAHAGSYGGLPILIFSRDTASFGSDSKAVDASYAWNQKQEELKKLSTRSRRIIAKGSGHYIQLQRPELIEREVRLFVEQIRGIASKPAEYGSTTTE